MSYEAEVGIEPMGAKSDMVIISGKKDDTEQMDTIKALKKKYKGGAKCTISAVKSLESHGVCLLIDVEDKLVDNKQVKPTICPACGGDGSFSKPYDQLCKGVVIKCLGKK